MSVYDALTSEPQTAAEIAEATGLSKQSVTHELKVLVADGRAQAIEGPRRRDAKRYALASEDTVEAPQEEPQAPPRAKTPEELEVEMVVNYVRINGPVTRMQVSTELGIDASRAVTILHAQTREGGPLRRIPGRVITYEGARE